MQLNINFNRSVPSQSDHLANLASRAYNLFLLEIMIRLVLSAQLKFLPFDRGRSDLVKITFKIYANFGDPFWSYLMNSTQIYQWGKFVFKFGCY